MNWLTDLGRKLSDTFLGGGGEGDEETQVPELVELDDFRLEELEKSDRVLVEQKLTELSYSQSVRETNEIYKAINEIVRGEHIEKGERLDPREINQRIAQQREQTFRAEQAQKERQAAESTARSESAQEFNTEGEVIPFPEEGNEGEESGRSSRR